ncbi:hypothetical protein CONLIGDRAFT_143469 [Coniochaeta ligniaria NRRL 30616]|uniref:Uncharacterized protein n=1 Tax=Coniochaeta ligniaria NRRL 30616 TaxID=1408157 RepID=A0A1J7I699_9PEZI|nr:hypothetical protein CONLIGDRAFT_143469 [Coniochaeta ligniaria NRRL 30616]
MTTLRPERARLASAVSRLRLASSVFHFESSNKLLPPVRQVNGSYGWIWFCKKRTPFSSSFGPRSTLQRHDLRCLRSFHDLCSPRLPRILRQRTTSPRSIILSKPRDTLQNIIRRAVEEELAAVDEELGYECPGGHAPQRTSTHQSQLQLLLLRWFSDQ